MRQSSGISLVEIIVTFSIIAIAFLALTMSQILGFRVTQDSAQSATARDIATQQLETIRGFGYVFYQDCPTLNPTVGPACQNASFPAMDDVPNHQGYTIWWSVTNAPIDITGNAINPAELTPALVGIEVRVNWDGGSYDLTSYMSCADAGEFSNNAIFCPSGSLL